MDILDIIANFEKRAFSDQVESSQSENQPDLIDAYYDDLYDEVCADTDDDEDGVENDDDNEEEEVFCANEFDVEDGSGDAEVPHFCSHVNTVHQDCSGCHETRVAVGGESASPVNPSFSSSSTRVDVNRLTDNQLAQRALCVEICAFDVSLICCC